MIMHQQSVIELLVAAINKQLCNQHSALKDET